MPKYIAKTKTWLSHENRTVEAGEIFETTFPKINGKEMKLGDNLELVKKPVATVKGNAAKDNLSSDGDNQEGEQSNQQPDGENSEDENEQS